MTDGIQSWRNLGQDELDALYSQRNFAPNMDQVLQRWRTNSAAVVAGLGSPLRFSYGAGEVEYLDVFPADQPSAPVIIFVHGGAWQEESAASHAFPAQCFVDAGISFVVPDFDWVQDVGRSLFPIVDQLRRAVMWVHDNAASFGADPDRLYVAGHSSGGHLAGVLLTTDWESKFDRPHDLIKGGMCCSGMFDLAPVRASRRGTYIAFTDEMEHALSPLRHLDTLRAPLILAYGSHESPEFKRQSRQFAHAASFAGRDVLLIEGEGYNHFEVIETLSSPLGLLGRVVLEMIRSQQR